MNISSKPEFEHIYPDKYPHGYEWWYFDAVSLNKEWVVTVTFFHGNPFSPHYLSVKYSDSPEDYPAVRISLFRKGKPEFYCFQEYSKSHFSWQEEETLHCVIGGCSFKRYDLLDQFEYELELNQKLDSGHSISGKLKFVAPKISPKLVSKQDKQDPHVWNLLQPTSKVVGTLKVAGKTDNFHIGFLGVGYHDHWVGQEQLGHSIKDCYLGHVHLGRETLVYALVDKYGTKQHEAWLIDRDNKMITGYFDKIEFSDPAKSRFGGTYYQKIRFTGVLGTITVEQHKKLYKGPLFIRFLANVTWDIEEENLDFNNILGITQYINPQWYEIDKYRRKAKSQIRFMRQKPTWRQRSRFLYELSW